MNEALTEAGRFERIVRSLQKELEDPRAEFRKELQERLQLPARRLGVLMAFLEGHNKTRQPVEIGTVLKQLSTVRSELMKL